MGQPDEQERVRELSRYYCTFNRGSTDSVRLSSDTTLTALTQLGVYRFGCNRSFVSIIDGDNQHVISEATASVSFRDPHHHRPGDGIFLGVRTLDLEWGVCPHVIRLFTGQDESQVQDTENITANRTRNIIRDFTKEDFYKDRPYVLGWPFFRFYAEVPLYSPSGFVLGSYCVVDDKPRTLFGDEEVSAFREIADAITNHLENARIVQYHRRSESLVKGLTEFVKTRSNFDPTGFSTQNQLETFSKMNMETLGLSPKSSVLNESVASLSVQDHGIHSTVGRTSSPGLNAPETSVFSRTGHSASKSTLPSSLSRTSSDRSNSIIASVDSPSEIIVPEDVPITQHIAMIFSRASILLKESLDLDGVAFLDAHRHDPQFDPFGQDRERKTAPHFHDSGDSIPSRTTLPQDGGQYCGFLDQPNYLAVDVKPGPRCKVMVTEDLLHSLITHFSEGHVFDLEGCDDKSVPAAYDNTNFRDSKPTQQIIQHLSQQIPNAKYVLFYPLWDWSKSRWLAGTLVWVSGCHRPLGKDELHYFKAFGDSIVSEVSRLHWTANENSKFDFVTSISHELRSPLHGILASTELLHDIPLQSGQKDIVKMISTSGTTLLDTIDHLLDFCKINNLGKMQELDKRKDQGCAMSLVSEFHLDQLIEEVAMILHIGRTSVVSKSLLYHDTTTGSLQAGSEKFGDVSLVINIEHPNPWKIRSVAGAWRRIVMNLLGNSLKWTQRGLIELSLSEVTDRTSGSTFTHLRFTDTGQGISQEFLKHSAFTPFSQEDALSEGVGLGLSIVHKLVTFLGGHVKIQSEVGVGTQVDLFVSSPCRKTHALAGLQSLHDSATVRSNQLKLKACLVGFNSYPDLAETPTGIMSSDSKRKLSVQNALVGVLKGQLGWPITLAEYLEKGVGDVAIIEEVKFKDTWNGISFVTTTGNHFKFFIVLSTTGPSLAECQPANVIFVHQPFCPTNIRQAAERVMELYALQQELKVQPDPAKIHVPLDCAEKLPLPVEAVSIPETAEKLVLETPNRPILQSPPEKLINASKNEVRVLIVDDNEINLKILATFIRKLGHAYDTATNGLIALEKVQSSSQRYDLILMDLSMPVMDGLVSTSKIRLFEKDNDLEPSCILAITGVASDTIQQAARTAGVNDYLIKPLSLHKLKTLISVLF